MRVGGYRETDTHNNVTVRELECYGFLALRAKSVAIEVRAVRAPYILEIYLTPLVSSLLSFV